MKTKAIRELFMNGRHWDLFVLITMQYVMDIEPAIRTNTDYIFVLKEAIRENREKLYKSFFGVFPSFAVFDALFLEVCQNHRCLVLDQTSVSTDVESCVYWYKSVIRPEFTLEADWWWQYAEQKGGTDGGPSEADRQRLEQMAQKAVHVVCEPKQSTRPTRLPTNHDRYDDPSFGPPPIPRGREREVNSTPSRVQYGGGRPPRQQPRSNERQDYDRRDVYDDQPRRERNDRRGNYRDESPPAYGYEYRETARYPPSRPSHQASQPATTYIRPFETQPQRAAYSSTMSRV